MPLGIAVAVNGMPDDALADAMSVEIHERLGESTTYRIRYAVDIAEDDLPVLLDNRLGPGSELMVLAPLADSVHCLVKGPVTNQQVHLTHGGAGSWVEVSGADTTVIMDRETQAVVWSNVTDSDAATSILSGYSYVPDIDSTDARHLEDKHALIQRDTDLGFVRRLARRNGFLFWVTADALGVETAHFRHPSLEGEPVATLSINQEVPSLESVELDWDVERPTSIEGTQLDLNALTDLDGAVSTSPLPTLGDSGLAIVASDPRSVHIAAPADDASDLQKRGGAALIDAGWFVRARCQTSVERLGSLVRAHTLVDLAGAGSRYSGTYLVSSVRHVIDAAEHRLEIELVRNGWGA